MSAASRFRLMARAATMLGVVLLSTPLPGAEPGRPLTEALLELRAEGLPIVFASNVVSAEMTVLSEPRAAALRPRLDELLAPHGLAVRRGPGEILIVVREPGAPVPGSRRIAGVVTARPNGIVVGGVQVVALGTDIDTTTASDGSYSLSGVPEETGTVEFRRRGFVVERRQLPAIEEVPEGRERAGEIELDVELEFAPITEEELDVTPSRVALMQRRAVSPIALSRDEILRLPHLGGDPFRALSLLPGVTGNDVSAEFHVRGGRRDETQILLDGQELYETYHLQDFDSAVSIIAPTTLESVDLSTGGFSVQHGDRMSGVLDMRTVQPDHGGSREVGVGLLTTFVGAHDRFAESRGAWLVHLRRGSIDLASKLLGPENPRFWDAFAKLDFQVAPRHNLRINALRADDELEFEEAIDTDFKRHETDYENTYVWATHQAIVGTGSVVETVVSTSRVDRSRLALELEEDAAFSVEDRRRLEVESLRQDWMAQAGSRHLLKWGLGLRRFHTTYGYDSAFEFDNPLAILRWNGEEGAIHFAARFDERHDNAYLSDQIEMGKRLTAELGLRYDRHSQTRETIWSPRLSAAWAVDERSAVRLSWGRYHQSQRPYELAVEDGETEFRPVERAEHRVLGYERLFGGGDKDAVALRVEAYQRRVRAPLPRYENLYEALNTFPELEPDRVRVSPDRSEAYGVELFLRGQGPERVGWWVNYAWARSEDILDGVRFERRFDQTHTLNLDIDLRLGVWWTANAAWRYHTGWPTTPLTLVPTPGDDGEVVFLPVLGPRFSDRLRDYHRMDIRVSRQWLLSRGVLEFFVDVQNLYDRQNTAGFDYQIDEETGELSPNEEAWAGILPSAGLSFQF